MGRGVVERGFANRPGLGFPLLTAGGVVAAALANGLVAVDAGFGFDLYSVAEGRTGGTAVAMAAAIVAVTLAVAGLAGLVTRLVSRTGKGDAPTNHGPAANGRRALLVVSVVMAVLPLCLLALLAIPVTAARGLALSLLVGLYQAGPIPGVIPTYSVVAGVLLGVGFAGIRR